MLIVALSLRRFKNNPAQLRLCVNNKLALFLSFYQNALKLFFRQFPGL
jgi:hypothetical protein